MYSLKNQFKNLFINEHRVLPLKNIIAAYKEEKINSLGDTSVDIDESFFEEDTPEIEKLKTKWQNYYSKYGRVIIGGIRQGEKSLHEILEIIDNFHHFYDKAGYQFQRRIASGEVKINDLEKLGSSSGDSSDKRTKSRTSIELKEGHETKDYKVIYNGSDWLVIEPKTTNGSIAWAYGLPNGREEKDTSARVNWCTASYGKSLSHNRFSMYAGNLHMFYFIKKPYPVNIDAYEYMDDEYLQNNNNLFINDEQVRGNDILNRRICLSFITANGKAILATDGQSNQHGAVVNAENSSFHSESQVLSVINNDGLYNKVKLVSQNKKETSFREMFSKITLPMLKREIITLSTPESFKDLFEQLREYSKYSTRQDVLDFLFNKYKFYPDILARLISNDNSPEKIVQFCYEIHTDSSMHNNYYSNYVPKTSTKFHNINHKGSGNYRAIFYSTINNDKFYNICNTIEKIASFLKDLGNISYSKNEPSTREKRQGFISLFFGNYNTMSIDQYVETKKAHYQKFNFEDVMKEFSDRKYFTIINTKIEDKLKKSKCLYENYDASKYLAEVCNVDLIETHNPFKNEYFLENQVQEYARKILSKNSMSSTAIVNIFLDIDTYNNAVQALEKVELKEKKLASIVNKAIRNIVNKSNHDGLEYHSELFTTLTLFLKKNQDKSSIYYSAESDLSDLVKAWLDYYIEEMNITSWEDISAQFESKLYQSFKYLYDAYNEDWVREEWDHELGEYITGQDDYYALTESNFKSALSRYIKLMFS